MAWLAHDAQDALIGVESPGSYRHQHVGALAAAGLEERERDELIEDRRERRLETVGLLLEGAPIPQARASARHGYDLAAEHTGLAVWTTAIRQPDPFEAAAARMLTSLAGAAPAKHASPRHA